MNLFKNNEIRNAVFLGIMCSISYLGCYFARNVLSVVSPQMMESTIYTVEFIGALSTGYMVTYGFGQLVNGRIGDLIKAKYLVGGGLFFAGVCNLLLPFLKAPFSIVAIYSMSGFFLSMLYAPIMRAVSENTLPIYATRCSLGFSVASFLGAPLASLVALLFAWKKAFIACGIILLLLGLFSFIFFIVFEKKGIVTYKEAQKASYRKIDIKVLLERSIVKFTLTAVLTGIVRTSVIFWIPTYLTQYLGLSEQAAAIVFIVVTLSQSVAPFIHIMVIYDLFLKRNSEQMLLLMFAASAISFALMFFVSNTLLNIFFLTMAVVTACGSDSIVFSIYCPSLKDTGMVSTVSGFVDAMSYAGAALANVLFSNAIMDIGWNRLIWIWAGFMFIGILISFPKHSSE